MSRARVQVLTRRRKTPETRNGRPPCGERPSLVL